MPSPRAESQSRGGGLLRGEPARDDRGMFARSLWIAGTVCVVAAALAPSVVAQEGKGEVLQPAPAPRFDVEPTLVALLQMARDTPKDERSVGTSAWIVLALIANGSTMRSGPHGDDVRAHIDWLVNRQQDTGAFAPRGVPCSRSEQLLAALAINEALAASGHYTQLERNVTTGIAAAQAMVRAQPTPPLTLDEFAVAILLARTASQSSTPAAIANSREVVAQARAGLKPGHARRSDAALHLDELLRGTKHEAELTVARTWPANLTADPLHTLIGALAVERTDEKTRAAWFATLATLVAARETKGEHAGTWAPAGGLDRTATTAIHAITLALANGGTPLFCAK
jgi:hypothetical protein